MFIMDAFRASIMETWFESYERKQLRLLSPGMQEQRERVMQALTIRHRLCDRMECCGTIDEHHNNMRLCGVPLCPRCFMRQGGREAGQVLKRTFVAILIEQLEFSTLLLPVLMGTRSNK
jgi:hypothetical protein